MEELHNALERVYTPDCRNQGCQKCGLCDFKSIFPVVHKQQERGTGKDNATVTHDRADRNNEKVFSYRIHYTRLGNSRFFSHLEILQLVFRALTRSRIPVLYSQGFNPSPRVSFSPALPVGMESEVEFFDIDLASPMANQDEVAANLNQELPDGMRVMGIDIKPGKEPEGQLVSYAITLEHDLTDEQNAYINHFLDRESFMIERVRKKKTRQIDIRPLVHSLKEERNTIFLELIHIQSKAGVNPKDILKYVLHLVDEEVLLARVKKDKVGVFSASA